MNKTTVMAEFIICGDNFNLNDMTNLLGLKPDKTSIKGHVSEGKNRPSIETVWCLNTKKEHSLDINNQLYQIISQLQDKRDILNTIRRDYNLDMIFEILIEIQNNEKPAIYFEVDTLEFISDISAKIDIDLYIYS